MGFFDSAKDSLKGAVSDVAEGSVDSVREAVQDAIQDQLEDLLGKAVVKMIASVNEELQSFAALHLATKEDISRLEALLRAASDTSVGPTPRSPRRREAAARTGPPATRAAERRPRARQARA